MGGIVARDYTRHENGGFVRPDGLRSIFCRSCGREIQRAVNPQIRSVSKCAICVLKDQGVEHPEEHVLQQYYLSNDPTKMPTPIDGDMSQEGGILVLYPDVEKKDLQGNPIQTGGLVGTVRSLFRALGFAKQPSEVPVSAETAKKKRAGEGLYGNRIR